MLGVTLQGTVPQFFGMSPTAAPVLGGALTLHLDGSRFRAESRAFFGGTALATTYRSPSELDAIVPRSLLSKAGKYEIVVFNPGAGGGPASEVLEFTVGSSVAFSK